MSRTSLFTAGAFLAGGIVGAVAGFKFAERRLMDEFNEAVEQERSSIAAMYAARQPYASPQEALDELVNDPTVVEATKSMVEAMGNKEPIAYHKIKPSSVQAKPVEEVETPDPIQEMNIFEQNQEPNEIHVIPQLEFEHGGEEFQKVSLTYYVEDKVLADQTDDTFDVVEDIIGDGVLHFGRESNDENVVYIRNARISVDYEVTRDPGSYWRTVHGMEPAEPRPSQNGG